MNTATTRPRILVCDPLHNDAIELLRQAAHVDVRTSLAVDELRDVIQGYDAIVVRSRTTVGPDIIEAGRQLRAIARAGVGVDNIDVDAATARGIPVVTAAGASAESVAELTLGLIFAVLRHIPQANQAMKAGEWPKESLRGQQLSGKTLGVIGYGQVGREVARLGDAFRASVLVASRVRHVDVGQRVELDQLLGESDIVSLHTHLDDTTRRMIDATAIAKMKAGAYLINTARGELVDEAALLAALESGKLAGAGLDVFAQEPPGASPLVRHPKVVCTPHIGAATDGAQRAVGQVTVEALLATLRGEPPETLANPAVLQMLTRPSSVANQVHHGRPRERQAGER